MSIPIQWWPAAVMDSPLSPEPQPRSSSSCAAGVAFEGFGHALARGRILRGLRREGAARSGRCGRGAPSARRPGAPAAPAHAPSAAPARRGARCVRVSCGRRTPKGGAAARDRGRSARDAPASRSCASWRCTCAPPLHCKRSQAEPPAQAGRSWQRVSQTEQQTERDETRAARRQRKARFCSACPRKQHATGRRRAVREAAPLAGGTRPQSPFLSRSAAMVDLAGNKKCVLAPPRCASAVRRQPLCAARSRQFSCLALALTPAPRVAPLGTIRS